MEDWYEPGEDSYTLYDVLKKENLHDLLIIDLGCSTGYITSLLDNNNLVISSDMNIKALLELNNKSLNPSCSNDKSIALNENILISKNAVKMDLLFGYDQSKVDCVIFNPPYVPDFDCPILGGGKFGREVIDKFVDDISVNLFYLLIIEANKPQEVVENIKKRGYKVEVLNIRKVIGETIIVLKGVKEYY